MIGWLFICKCNIIFADVQIYNVFLGNFVETCHGASQNRIIVIYWETRRGTSLRGGVMYVNSKKRATISGGSVLFICGN